MIIIQQGPALSDYVRKQRSEGFSIGFVPTMGALHDGHLQLVNHSTNTCDVTVCSIFVNPTQFNDPNDFKKYPNTIDRDIRLLAGTKATVLFLPAVSAIYPAGINSLERYELGFLETILEGRFRPGHFQGVCQVMSRLLKITDPDYLFMGQKDYQQCMVIRRLLQLLAIRALLVTHPTVREPDGVAMSSRNMRLNVKDRSRASLIFQVLSEIKTKIAPGDLSKLKHEAAMRLQAGGFRVEYVEIADAATLLPYNEWDGHAPLVALAAAFLGEVRLIDNMLLNC
jgi:pantoate--beta-alanine ligase